MPTHLPDLEHHGSAAHSEGNATNSFKISFKTEYLRRNRSAATRHNAQQDREHTTNHYELVTVFGYTH
jgi:hypothetical protein